MNFNLVSHLIYITSFIPLSSGANQTFFGGNNNESLLCWDLVWLVDALWERDYVPNQLLGGVCLKSNTVITEKVLRSKPSSIVRENTILVSRPRKRWDGAISCLKSFISARIKSFIFIVVGDESGVNGKKCSFEPTYDSVPLVIRNYWTYDCANRTNILQVPLGLAQMFVGSRKRNRAFTESEEASISFVQRKYVWSFSSNHIVPIRDVYIEHIKALRMDHPEYNNLFIYNESARQIDSYEMLSNSIFALCPEGTSPETWRFYESIECGAIPVVNSSTVELFYQFVLPCNISEYIVATKYPEIEIPKLLRNLTSLTERRDTLVSNYKLWRDDWKQRVAWRVQEVGLAGHRNDSFVANKEPLLNTTTVLAMRTASLGRTSYREYLESNNFRELFWDFDSCKKHS